MTSGHLVADTDLTLLGDIDLGHLHDARGELVADGDVKLLAAQLAVNLFRLAQIIGDQTRDHAVDACIGCPAREVDGLVVDCAECHIVKLHALRHDVGSDEVFHTL